jgi:hypothetical protein
MMKTILGTGLVLAAFSTAAFAASTGFYVEQDVKTKKCMVSDKAPDGKTMVDVGTKVYENQANADKALSMLKACDNSAAAAPAAAGFYVAKDAKTGKCAVVNKAPDGKMAMDVGTKVYETQGNADKALSMLKACDGAAAAAPAAPAAPAAAAKPAAPAAAAPAPAAPAAAAKPAAPAAAPAAAAGFYVAQDAKTHKCAVMAKAPDGKTAMDVGTKVYATQGNAEQAMSALKACN